MQDFSEATKQAFELYANGDAKRALSLLTPATRPYDFIKIVDFIKTDKGNLMEDTKNLIRDYKHKYLNYSSDVYFAEIIDMLIQMEEYEFVWSLSDHLGLCFTHDKPYWAQRTIKDRSDNIYSSKWNQNEYFNDKREIVKVYTSDYAINSLHKSLWNDVDFLLLSDITIEAVTSNLESFAGIANESFLKRIAKLVNDKYQCNSFGYFYTIPTHYLTKMSLEQMENFASLCSWAKSDSNFIHIKFQKKYYFYLQDPEFHECSSLQEKRNLLVQMLDECQGESQSLKSWLARQILEYGIKLDIYDKKIFIEYLKYPISNNLLKYSWSSIVQGDEWSYLISNLKICPGYNDQSLYSKLLYKFYSIGDDWKNFSDYFDSNWMNNLKLEFDFLEGK